MQPYLVVDDFQSIILVAGSLPNHLVGKGNFEQTPVLVFYLGPDLQKCSNCPSLTFLHGTQQCCVSPPRKMGRGSQKSY